MEWAAIYRSDLVTAWETVQRGGHARVEPLPEWMELEVESK